MAPEGVSVSYAEEDEEAELSSKGRGGFLPPNKKYLLGYVYLEWLSGVVTNTIFCWLFKPIDLPGVKINDPSQTLLSSVPPSIFLVTTLEGLFESLTVAPTLRCFRIFRGTRISEGVSR